MSNATEVELRLIAEVQRLRGSLNGTLDLLAALVYRNGGDVTITTYDLQRSPTGSDLEVLYMPNHDEHRLRLR